MNIFVVDRDPEIAARMLCDQHVVKMPTECVQIICTAHAMQMRRRIANATRYLLSVQSKLGKSMWSGRLEELNQGPHMPWQPVRPLEHKQHPCIMWVQQDPANLRWLCWHAQALCEEYTFRFGKRHAAQDALERAREVKLSTEAWRFKSHRQSLAARRPEDYKKLWDRMNFVQAMPEKYQERLGTALRAERAYRRYYIGDKTIFARWTNGREPPEWWPFSTSRPPHGNLDPCLVPHVSSASISP